MEGDGSEDPEELRAQVEVLQSLLDRSLEVVEAMLGEAEVAAAKGRRRGGEVSRPRDARDLAHSLVSFRKRLRAEEGMLDRLRTGLIPLTANRVKSSNLHALSAILATARKLDGLVRLGGSFKYGAKAKVYVDAVVKTHSAVEWLKVKVTPPVPFHNMYAGHGRASSSSMIDQARHLLDAAAEHPHGFTIPAVVYVFVGGVSISVAADLEALGIVVRGERVDLGPLDGVAHAAAPSPFICPSTLASFGLLDSPAGPLVSAPATTVTEAELADLMAGGKIIEDAQGNRYVVETIEEYEYEYDEYDEPEGNDNGDVVGAAASTPPADSSAEMLNLDVSAILAYVSDLCQPGGAETEFDDPLIAKQAASERQQRQLPLMERMMAGKRLVVCETALASLQAILDTVAGPGERARAEALLANVAIVPDELSERMASLRPTLRIKPRARVVFGVGDALGVPTLTANNGFVRAAAQQGYNFKAIVIMARALTESRRLEQAGLTPDLDTGCA
ncbi:UPF0415 protein C7orf25 [Thecamonas trahens ATCC 50062]|uniref:UPF0415 protein C7orf25 n=1 Tax=Thecamonas trahens ATCC 50062 TaxID=461836 RepID=A0A0L0DEX7_THETB|nr:UPF0415 protein C7orf25 [Thecamonas trahens ATCC 50062]KNC49873.1 UPF0415 protein C7orf25 [Thecamonas trahens ATCC 50062]|eukprot:XP_013757357.1 UPF0415 protein C7orf25 [Thecamonas trahens ATCC 50062]